MMETEVGALPSAMTSSPLADVRPGTITFRSAHSSVALNSCSSERRLMNTWPQTDTITRYTIIKWDLRRWNLESRSIQALSESPGIVRDANATQQRLFLEGARYKRSCAKLSSLAVG